MNPLTKQAPCIVDFFTDELNFDFFVHVNLFRLEKTVHEDVRFL